MKKYYRVSIRRDSTPEFLEVFRKIVYSPKITYGAKALALCILDAPLTPLPGNTKLSRKLGSSPNQVLIWKKELRRHKLLFRHEKNWVPKY